MAERGADARRGPVSTYRLQLQPGNGFADAAAIAGYLAALGVTHVYLSPILQAAPGSRHGYDVVDHSRISADLGGEDAFRAMVARFRRHGLGVIVDIVPNHMAIPVPESLNRQLWSVLREGTGSPYAHWFDIDWAAHDGRLLLPILAGPIEDCLDDVTVDRSGEEPAVRYFGHALPVRSGTAGLPLTDLLAAQHYRLAHWRVAATELNWRRFFDITSLIGLRVEDPDVFTGTHARLLSLAAEGLIDGLRVDHPDGLADPRGYLRRLADASGAMWVVAEKILTGTEKLPADWPCAGTTGYDTLRWVGGLFVDPSGREPLTRAYVDFTKGRSGFAGVAHAAKRDAAGCTLAAEVSRLAGLLARAHAGELTGFSAEDLREVLAGLLTAFPVYRAYVLPGEPAPHASTAVMAAAAVTARRDLPIHLHEALDAVCGLLLGRGSGPAHDELIVRFQQTCGPVMAKGVEDTAFYRWSNLICLNEVGGDPDLFGVAPDDFHAAARRLARDWPATLTTLSTHDTKRQEDVRARLAVLAESPRMWAQEVTAWHDRAARLTGAQVPEPHTEYLMWQTLVGAWPIDRDRLTGYLRKAMREAKTRTSWTDPDTGYESAVLAFAAAVRGDHELTTRIAGFAERIAPDARVNALGAKLVQLTMPGVADVYQGCELAGFALVDPDNRRPVDFGRRRELLASLDAGAAGLSPADPAGPEGPAGPAGETDLDAGKLLVTSRTLRLRRDHPEWFAGSYTPLRIAGPAAPHAIAFLRAGEAATVATRLPAGLRRGGGWADTVLTLPGGRWRDLLTGVTHDGARLPLAVLTRRLPVALLVKAPVVKAPVVGEGTSAR